MRRLVAATAAVLAVCSVLYLFGRKNTGVYALWLLAGLFAVWAVWWKAINHFLLRSLPGRVLLAGLCAGVVLFFAALAAVLWGSHGAIPAQPPQAIVVLGGAIQDSRPLMPLRYRLEKALELHHQYPAALLVVSGGQGADENEPEAAVMARWLAQQGVPAGQILQEAASTSTEENFAFSRPILEAAGVEAEAPLLYVTNGFHCYRAGRYAALAGYSQAQAAPAGLGASQVLPCYLREVLAVAYYWVFRSPHVGFMRRLVGYLGPVPQALKKM